MIIFCKTITMSKVKFKKRFNIKNKIILIRRRKPSRIRVLLHQKQLKCKFHNVSSVV